MLRAVGLEHRLQKVESDSVVFLLFSRTWEISPQLLDIWRLSVPIVPICEHTEPPGRYLGFTIARPSIPAP